MLTLSFIPTIDENLQIESFEFKTFAYSTSIKDLLIFSINMKLV